MLNPSCTTPSNWLTQKKSDIAGLKGTPVCSSMLCTVASFFPCSWWQPAAKSSRKRVLCVGFKTKGQQATITCMVHFHTENADEKHTICASFTIVVRDRELIIPSCAWGWGWLEDFPPTYPINLGVLEGQTSMLTSGRWDYLYEDRFSNLNQEFGCYFVPLGSK